MICDDVDQYGNCVDYGSAYVPSPPRTCPPYCDDPPSDPCTRNCDDEVESSLDVNTPVVGDDECSLGAEYLCALPEDEWVSVSNGNYSSYTASFWSLAPIYVGLALTAYFYQPVILASLLPQTWIPIANVILVGAEALTFALDPVPGAQIGDVTVTISHSSEETSTVYGYTVPAYTEVNQYVLRDSLDGWQLLEASNTVYDYQP
jgi:hypothetical protein